MARFRDVLRGLVADVAVAGLTAVRKAVEDDEEDADGAGEPAPGAPAANDPGDAGGEGTTEGAGDPDGGDGAQMPVSPLALVHGQPQQMTKPMVPQTPEEIQEAREDPRSLFWDPYAVIDALGYKDRPSSMSYATLRQMVWRMPIVQSIIQTRIQQVASFALPQVDKFSTGFRVSLRDKKQKPTPASEARSQQLERWLMTTGVTDHPENRDDFETFLAKIVRDTLTYDQMTFEIVPSAEDKPAAFYAVDAATIRIADSTKLFLDPEDESAIRFVQIYDGVVCTEYTGRELCFGVRNPATDIRLQGYGQSELEMLVSTVTALLWAWDYNLRGFSQGSQPKGVINVKGPVPPGKLRMFRQQWWAQVAGVENAFRTPIVNIPEGAEWLNMQQSAREMEYNAWFDFLIKLASAMYLMDPMEINFKYGDSGVKSQFESANQSKLTASKDRGLKPLLRFIQRKLNTHLIHLLDEDFEMEFVGLEARTPAEQADLDTKLVKTTKTVDEIRVERDDPPLPNGMGNIILDPVFMQHMLQGAQQAQGVGAFAPPPPPGEEGDDGDPFSKLKKDLGGAKGGGGSGPPASSNPEGSDDNSDADVAAKSDSVRKAEVARVVIDLDL